MGLWTTKHFASDTQHVRCFLVKAVLIRLQQVHKVWLFCCFRWFASLPQRTLKCNILKTFLIFNTTGSHFCTLNLLQFFFFFEVGALHTGKARKGCLFLTNGPSCCEKREAPSTSFCRNALIGTLLTRWS